MTTETTLTNAEAALLGLLAEGPAHPWQLQKDVEFRDMRSWTDLSQSTIYKQLRSLESKGFVTSAEEVAEGRLRKVYAITAEGADALTAGLLGMLREPEQPKWRIDLATYNVDRVPVEAAREALREYGAALRERAEGWRALERYLAESGCPAHRMAIARRAVRMIEGELVWLDEFMSELGGR